jgi:hypothetical protein
MGMPKTTTPPPAEREVKTGRRENPAINGPRDKTVCFMLSEAERVDVDRLAFCLNLTRSGVLAKIVATFVEASGETEKAKDAEKELRSYLAHCRKEVKLRGALAAESIPNPTEKRP